jgi:hypothetical protein
MSERPKLFTLDEAELLRPVLESLLRSAMEQKSKLEEIDGEFNALASRVLLTGGVLLDIPKVAARKAEREKVLQRVNDALAEITASGVQVKDLDIGLLDFPCERDGELVLLCWKLGEPRVAHWHGLEEGFAGRKPIDDRILRPGGEKKNN